MKTLNIKDFSYDKCNFVFQDQNTESEIFLKVIGKIATNSSDQFDIFFSNLHKEIIDNNIKTIKLDALNLEYINSTAIKTLISWISSVKKLPTDQRYNINFIYSGSSPWQETTFSMLNRAFSNVVFLNEVN